MKDPNEIVAVKCEGCFTEWYSPFFKNPFEDNAEYREFFYNNLLSLEPVIGPSIGNDECLSGDLGCLSDRLTVAADNWDMAKDDFEEAVDVAMKSGEVQVVDFSHTEPNVLDIKITPYRRKDMPKVDEVHLQRFGKFADLMRERVAAI